MFHLATTNGALDGTIGEYDHLAAGMSGYGALGANDSGDSRGLTPSLQLRQTSVTGHLFLQQRQYNRQELLLARNNALSL